MFTKCAGNDRSFELGSLNSLRAFVLSLLMHHFSIFLQSRHPSHGLLTAGLIFAVPSIERHKLLKLHTQLDISRKLFSPSYSCRNHLNYGLYTKVYIDLHFIYACTQTPPLHLTRINPLSLAISFCFAIWKKSAIFWDTLAESLVVWFVLLWWEKYTNFKRFQHRIHV